MLVHEKETKNVTSFESPTASTTYPVVGTNQTAYYDNSGLISAPSVGQPFYGQNASYPGNAPQYKDNGDGTVSDLVTGLMWQKSPDTNGDGVISFADKMIFDQALAAAPSLNLAGYTDWRLPSIKELYSLIMFSGAEPLPSDTSPGGAVPFINTAYFGFAYGDLSAGERIIDAQYATSTLYVSTTMSGNRTMFGVNFPDGRIKGYPTDYVEGPVTNSESGTPRATPGMQKKYYVLYVRGNADYGNNEFEDNGDGTITDKATGLMWMKNDSSKDMSWEDALSYAASLHYAGHDDWRLPDVKQLQSIVDYTRSPATTQSPAIDPLFNCTQIINEAGQTDYPQYSTSTTHSRQSTADGGRACYICFGRGMGYMSAHGGWADVHGAGTQRSDPKTGDPSQYPDGDGPQGDAMRIKNYVRLVRIPD